MSIKIMIIDNDQLNSRVLNQNLMKRGFTEICVSSGEDCLRILDIDTPDLIILDLDIVMVGMNGIQLIQSIRSIYSSIDIPIILKTRKAETKDIVEAMKFGANDYIQRPVDIEIVEMRINAQIISARNYRDAIERNEVESLNTLIATYNHEINNPLTIAYGLLRKAKKEKSLEYFDRIAQSLQRVAKIVKDIENITSRTKYTDLEITQKMYKIR